MRIEHKYDDIIKLEHHVSKTHLRMSLEARSAQFAPFSAVTGYEEFPFASIKIPVNLG